MSKEIKYGDIYYYDFGESKGSVQKGMRPAVVIQSNRINENSTTTIIAAITSSDKNSQVPSHIFVGDVSGLKKKSTILLEQVRTVNQNELVEKIGTIESRYVLAKLKEGINKTYDSWNYEKRTEKNICSLCPQCVREYINTSGVIVRRVDPFTDTKHKCNRCSRVGYEYWVYGTKFDVKKK